MARVYDERVAKDAAYPSILPSAGDVADDVHTYEHQTTREDSPAAVHEGFDLAIAHAPPGYLGSSSPSTNSLLTTADRAMLA